MVRRVLQVVILLPVAVVLVAFSLANRHAVTVSLDPFGGAEPSMSLSLPLFVLIFAVLLLGVLLGGVGAWLRQGRWRRQARQEHREAERWRRRAEEEARRAARQGPATAPAAALSDQR